MNMDVKVLNEVIENMIDSREGYEKAADVLDQDAALKTAFLRRAEERDHLIGQLQNQVRTQGGEPATQGSASGTMHRALLSFTSTFMDDAQASLKAVDDGEGYLADEIQTQIKQNNLDPTTTLLLEQAGAHVKEGELLADHYNAAT